MIKQRNKIRDLRSPSTEDPVIKYPAKVVWNDVIVGEMKKSGIIDFYDYKTGFELMEKIGSEGWGTKNIDERGNPVNYFRIVKLGKKEDEKILKKNITKSSPFMKDPDDINILKNSSNVTTYNNNLSIGFDIV